MVVVISYGPVVGCCCFLDAFGRSGNALTKNDSEKNGPGPSNTNGIILAPFIVPPFARSKCRLFSSQMSPVPLPNVACSPLPQYGGGPSSHRMQRARGFRITAYYPPVVPGVGEGV